MNYYLRTLEGVGRCFGGALYDEFYNLFGAWLEQYKDRKRAAYQALINLRVKYPNADFGEIYDIINDNYNRDPGNYYNVYEGAKAYRITESRQRQQAQAQAAASEQERAHAAYYEAAQAEAERDTLELIKEQEAAQAAAVEQAQEIINEVEPMQEINIENQLIESTPTYTIIDETADSITYEDEAGNVHVEPKASAAPWILAAAAAVLFLA